MTRLTHDETELRLADIPGWGIADGSLHRELEFAKSFRFRTFRDALAWMVRAGFEAEAMNHHPDWSNGWNRVVIDIASHSEGGITDRCIELAAAINRALGE